MPDAIDVAIDRYIQEIEEAENLKQEGEKIRLFQKEIKETFHANLDDLHRHFLDKYFKEYSNTNDTDIYLIKDVFDFLKNTK